MTNLTGRLLIASPYLGDDNFFRSVIFMIRHDVEGAFGLVLNRTTSRRFRDIVEMSLPPGKIREDDWIHRGGPVEGPLLALHDLAGVGEPCGLGGGEQTDGVKCTIHHHPAEPWGSMSLELSNPPAWLTGDDDHLRILLRRPDARVRYIAHYSGWGPSQLDHELESGGWLVGEATSDIIFSDAAEMWQTAVKACGENILADVAPGMSFDIDPTLN